MLTDEAVLRLLRVTDVGASNEVPAARAACDAIIKGGASGPTFDELAQQGWVREAWGRFYMPRDTTRAARALGDGAPATLAAVMALRFGETVHVADAARSDPELISAIDLLDRDGSKLGEIGSMDPGWVAARLWDRSLSGEIDPMRCLKRWVDHWTRLEWPKVIASRAWDDTSLHFFRETAFRALEEEATLLGWSEVRRRFVREQSVSHACDPGEIDLSFPACPNSLIEKVVWFDNQWVEACLMASHDALSHLLAPVHILLLDITEMDHALAPHPVLVRLLDLAMERPELLVELAMAFRHHPVLLADLVLCPSASAWACLIIARWPPMSGAWDRRITEQDDQSSKLVAFADAASIATAFLGRGSLPVGEMASLLEQLHSDMAATQVRKLGNVAQLLAALRMELIRQPREQLLAVATSLIASIAGGGLMAPAFAAALDVVGSAGLIDEVDPRPFITAYRQALDKSDWALSVDWIDSDAAATLFGLAGRDPALRAHFLSDIDVRGRLALTPEGRAEVIGQRAEVAKSLRVHIRLLCRIASGAGRPVPDDVASALARAISAGAILHPEKGRVSAFMPLFEKGFGAKRGFPPIADDIAAGLNALSGQFRRRLLAAFLTTDEPMVLAQSLSRVPSDCKEPILNRLAELTPREAADIHSLTDIEARIEVLLSAGAAELAAQYIEAERDLKTWGTVAGRRVTRLRNDLRLHLLRGEWDEIASVSIPDDLSPADNQNAGDTVAFYRALALLLKPNGNPAAAAETFGRLRRRRPDIVAYAYNLFAAQIAMLLGGDLFGQLTGEQKTIGLQALDDAGSAFSRNQPPDADGFTINRALLTLAVGDPATAIAILDTLTRPRLADQAAAFRAVSLSRLGRSAEAEGVLLAAERAFGPRPVVMAAREHVRAGTAQSGAINVTLTDDHTLQVKLALSDFARMEPARQAQCWDPDRGTFETFVTEHVRVAAAAIADLVPMMARLELDGSEDDVSSVLLALLRARLDFVSWQVSDQSRGGYTAAGNAGRRDIVIQSGGATLAIVEAVASRRPTTHAFTKSELTSHFQKLVGYSTCRLFFHVTYAFLNDVPAILKLLSAHCSRDTPPEFEYVSQEPLPSMDTRPPGFAATYKGGQGNTIVVFLVIDLGQHRQREAARSAGLSNPRTPSRTAR